MIVTQQIEVHSEGEYHSFNITDEVRQVVVSSGIQQGSVLVFYKHTSGTVVIVEHEAGMLVDLETLLEQITPTGFDYKHHLRGYDQNGAAHLRTALFGVSVSVPVQHGEMLLGTYQEIIVIDFDRVAKTRTIVVQVTGE